MFILRKNHEKEVNKLKDIIDGLEDRNCLLLNEMANQNEEIDNLNETVVELCEKHDTETNQKNYKIESLENDISNLKKYASQCNKKIEKFKINSILKLQHKANKTKKIRIKNKKQKLHNNELISTLEKML
ncbi:MAG TPA: hypothetical protein DDY58_01365 [Terrisporobacter glycolicus]|uniref:hypothetical protein n=1 Tax=Terrisporobacter TaxID=1505652 RepID=UPI000E961E76|nr:MULTISPECIES: hypothetical protein [Terrisporobacter]HBI91175.1 hypothetical protein [Terrisporobacter hibernicus]